MTDVQTAVYILSVILFGMNLFIGVFLVKRAKITGLTNIKWLSLYFFFTVIEFVTKMVFSFAGPAIGVDFISIFYFSINLTGHIFLIVFVKYTFYVDRKSSYFIIILSVIVSKIAYVITYTITEIQDNLLLYFIKGCIASYIIFISSFWLCYAALSTYNTLKKQDIAPWVKKRYLFVGISPIFLIAQVIPVMLTPYNYSFSDPFMANLILILTILNCIFAILSLLSWVMPKWLKTYLNQGYQTKGESMFSFDSDDSLMAKIKSQLEKGGSNGNN